MSKNADLHKRRIAAIPRGVGNSLAVYAERAQNAELWDVEGRRYVDFASGIAVVNTGHVHPHVKAAMAAQLEKITHGCFQVTPYESLHRAGRSAEQARARADAEEDDLPVDRRGGGRERDQDRALRHEAVGDHRVHRRLSRPHARPASRSPARCSRTRPASVRCCPKCFTCPSRWRITA